MICLIYLICENTQVYESLKLSLKLKKIIIFDLSTPPQGHQFDHRVKTFLYSCILFYSSQGWVVETTPCFNRLKPPWSICKKVVNTGQYKSKWSIEIFKWPFWWWIEILGQDLRSIYWKEKKYCFVPAKGTFYLSTDFCITVQVPENSLFNHQGQNKITIQPNRIFFIILRQ